MVHGALKIKQSGARTFSLQRGKITFIYYNLLENLISSFAIYIFFFFLVYMHIDRVHVAKWLWKLSSNKKRRILIPAMFCTLRGGLYNNKDTWKMPKICKGRIYIDCILFNMTIESSSHDLN